MRWLSWNQHFVVKANLSKFFDILATMDDWITMHDFKKLRQQHQITLKERDEIYKCEICDKEFNNDNGLNKHFNNVHKFVKEHCCKICQKVFHSLDYLYSHVKTVHKEKHHKCDTCEKSYCSKKFFV